MNEIMNSILADQFETYLDVHPEMCIEAGGVPTWLWGELVHEFCNSPMELLMGKPLTRLKLYAANNLYTIVGRCPYEEKEYAVQLLDSDLQSLASQYINRLHGVKQ